MVKRVRTSKDEEFVKHLEDLIEKVKKGEVEECQIKAVVAKEKKKHDVEDLTEEDCKKLLHAIFHENDEDEDEEEPVCNGDCESCENYVEEEEDDPKEVLDDLANVLGCLTYYRLPLSPTLLHTYNEAYFKVKEAEYADDEDS